jgi:hypothetical protein
MTQARETERVRSEVAALLSRGFFDRERDSSLEIGEPLVVSHPDGTPYSWFVPLLRGMKLAGFAQLLPSLIPLGVSSFQPDSLPAAADWIDTNVIRQRAISMLRAGERLSEPVLSYDQQPARIAWRALAISPSGETRTLYVAGPTVYEGRAGGLV